MITEFDSIFHENGFIFVNERSSYNRNGNREGIGATSAEEYRSKKGKYEDPRNKMRGSDSKERRTNVKNKKGFDAVNKIEGKYNDKAIENSKKNGKAMERNLKGSQKYTNADRSMKSWVKGFDDYKSREKIVKHYDKKEKQAVNASALMESIELI